ncbi:MAG: NADH-quinone oxidoreductase subunit J [Saprospiraceae bacterium]|nr:NADH-quinone oxidoreductase subunit J [Saprospiraceae bacterium]
MTPILFYAFATIAVLTAVLVVASKNPVHSVLYLILCFVSIAIEYILLNAQFLAIVHLIVYAGAIMVLFLFVLMLLNLNSDTEPQKSTIVKIIAAISGSMVLLTLVAALNNGAVVSSTNTSVNMGLVKNLGLILFTEYVVPFELSSILFLAAMVGAVMLGKKDKLIPETSSIDNHLTK